MPRLLIALAVILFPPVVFAQESVHSAQLAECGAEGKLAGLIAEARDQGATIQQEIQMIEGFDLSDSEKADDERIVGRVYDPPRLSPKAWEGLAYRTCLELQTSN